MDTQTQKSYVVTERENGNHWKLSSLPKVRRFVTKVWGRKNLISSRIGQPITEADQVVNFNPFEPLGSPAKTERYLVESEYVNKPKLFVDISVQ